MRDPERKPAEILGQFLNTYKNRAVVSYRIPETGGGLSSCACVFCLHHIFNKHKRRGLPAEGGSGRLKEIHSALFYLWKSSKPTSLTSEIRSDQWKLLWGLEEVSSQDDNVLVLRPRVTHGWKELRTAPWQRSEAFVSPIPEMTND